jgi:hypothetical protein
MSLLTTNGYCVKRVDSESSSQDTARDIVEPKTFSVTTSTLIFNDSKYLNFNFEFIPESLRSIPRWVVWKDRKVPYDARALNSKANVVDPDTWASFEHALTVYNEGGFEGLGFVLNSDGIIGIDIDGCITDEKVDPAAISFHDEISAGYVEVSPSGTGLRCFGKWNNVFKGKRMPLPRSSCGATLEIYSYARYLTVTGRVMRVGDITQLKNIDKLLDGNITSLVQKRTEENISNSSIFLCSPLLSSVTSGNVGIDDVIPERFLPKQFGKRHQRLFDFARYLKSKYPKAQVESMRSFVQKWHAEAYLNIHTKDFAVTWAEFIYGWDRVNQPFGAVMATVIANAESSQFDITCLERLGYEDHARKLVVLCSELQKMHDPDPFFLSCRIAAQYLKVSPTEANRMLKTLIFDGILRLFASGSMGKASRYKFIFQDGIRTNQLLEQEVQREIVETTGSDCDGE